MLSRRKECEVRKLVGRFSDELVSQETSRRGFMKALAQVSIAGGAVILGLGKLSVASASCPGSSCCLPACCYGNDNETCPPWNCPGQPFCCGIYPRYYGCAPCLYCGTQTVSCYATYYGPGGSCPALPSP